MSRVPLKEAARGRWRDVLTALGVPVIFFNGKHQACPLCGGKDRARFDDKDGCGTYFCSRCGPGDGVMLVQKLRNVDFKGAAALIEPLLGTAERREPSVEFTDEQKRKWMRDLWEGGLPITAADPAGMWLAGRTGVDAFPSCLRFHDAVSYKDSDGKRSLAPGMLAKVTDRDGMPVNVHRTYLTYRGEKAPIAKPRAMMPGLLPPGAAVRLAPAGGSLGIAEGIETAIAASVLHSIPVWAALNAGLLSKWSPPPGVQKVVVFGDNDSNFVGQAAAFQLAHRIDRDLGLAVEVRIPRQSDTDWNAVLQEKAA